MNEIRIEVDGQKVLLDVELDTAINDLTEDMKLVPGQIAWYGRLLAAARHAADAADDFYRQWRATFSENYAAKNPKAPEWRTKQAIETSPGFIEHKKRVRAAEELALRLEKAYHALTVKADMLRSLGARERVEYTNSEVHSRPAETERRPRETREEKDAKVKAAMGGRKNWRQQPPADNNESDEG